MTYISNLLRDFRSAFQRLDSKILLRQTKGFPNKKWIYRFQMTYDKLSNIPADPDNMIEAYRLGMTAVDTAIMLAILGKV